MMGIRFDNSYARLPEAFFHRQDPTPAPHPRLLRMNEELAAELGLDRDWLASPDGVAMLSGNALPVGAEPLAQAYAGHQFGGWVPQLGDGRALLLGEVVVPSGERYDIQLKGSGRTPFSRGGDGKSALGPVLREYLVSEAMAALGIPTTRALAAVATGETVRREEPLPGGMFTRVAASHILVGTFQYFLAREDNESLRRLADHVIDRHYPEAAGAASPYLALLECVVAAQADLVARWMAAGFIHGVMNTDNVAVSGQTIDYGPCAFMDTFHPQRVFSSIDHGGRYAWANQPSICHWNLTRFAETLIPLIAAEGSREVAVTRAEAALAKFADRFHGRYLAGFRAKLGLPASLEAGSVATFVRDTLTFLAEQEIDFTLFFRWLTRVADGGDPAALAGLATDASAALRWQDDWRALAGANLEREAMRSSNPVIIPRNHRIEQAIQSAYRGDFDPFHRLCDALANPYSEQCEFADLEAAPHPDEIVQETFCGT